MNNRICDITLRFVRKVKIMIIYNALKKKKLQKNSNAKNSDKTRHSNKFFIQKVHNFSKYDFIISWTPTIFMGNCGAYSEGYFISSVFICLTIKYHIYNLQIRLLNSRMDFKRPTNDHKSKWIITISIGPTNQTRSTVFCFLHWHFIFNKRLIWSIHHCQHEFFSYK